MSPYPTRSVEMDKSGTSSRPVRRIYTSRYRFQTVSPAGLCRCRCRGCQRKTLLYYRYPASKIRRALADRYFRKVLLVPERQAGFVATEPDVKPPRSLRDPCKQPCLCSHRVCNPAFPPFATQRLHTAIVVATHRLFALEPYGPRSSPVHEKIHRVWIAGVFLKTGLNSGADNKWLQISLDWLIGACDRQQEC